MLRFQILAILTLALVAIGCNDRARCGNACQRAEDCGLLSGSVDACTDACDEELTQLGENISVECEEATSDVVLCESFASCTELEENTACEDDKATADAACSTES